MVNNQKWVAGSDDDPAIFEMDFNESINKLKKEKIHISSELFQSILKCWTQTCLEKKRIYSDITENLLNINFSDHYDDEDLDVFNYNLENVYNHGLNEINEPSTWNEFIDKIRDHIKLVQHQKKLFSKVVKEADSKQKALGAYFYEKTGELEYQSKEIEYQISKLESNIKQLSSLSEKVKKKSKKVQRDFISILGIFAAILLASFGGLTVLSNILNNLGAPLGKIMILGSLCMMSILTLVFLLLNGIAKLTGEKLRNCGCKNGKCTCTLDKKHPTLFISAIFCVLIISFGALEMLIDFNEVRFNLNAGALASIFILITVGIIIFSFTYSLGYFSIDNKNDHK